MILTRITVLVLLSVLASSSSLSPQSPNLRGRSGILPRDGNADNMCPPTATACGGRKIGLVIDSSGSNVDNDPNDLRVEAAKDIAGRLVSASEATDKVKADQVTVVDFDSSAVVIYPLGDPAGADFSEIDSAGGTYIADGVREATNQITGSTQGQTKGVSGMVVLTDGEDNSVKELTAEITKAGDSGIRVHFGFLDPTGLGPTGSSSTRENFLGAILGTGGIYSTISSAEAQKNFVDLIYSQGLTAQDNPNPNGTSGLLPGLTVARLIDSNEPVKFTYPAVSGEKLNFTVSSLSKQALTCTLRKGKKEVATASTTASGGRAIMKYESSQNAILSLEVRATEGQGVMQVEPGTNMPNATRSFTSSATTLGGKSSPFVVVGMSMICILFAMLG